MNNVVKYFFNLVNYIHRILYLTQISSVAAPDFNRIQDSGGGGGGGVGWWGG